VTDAEKALEAGTESAEHIRGDLHSALTALEEAKARPYFDADTDQGDADRYYDGVTVAQLSTLLTRTHRDRPRYQPAKELYPWIDLQPDRKIRSLYTGHTYEPADLIAEDLQVEELRAERLRVMARDAVTHVAAVEEELERELPFNCEHVVPQSWFDKKEPMRGDLHHLFACESRRISFRGNTPYTEFAYFPAIGKVVRTDCGKSEQNGFEPAFGKGAAARAASYFLVRYSGVVSTDELPLDRFGVLLDWHEHDPVSLWERHRNAAIFARQGNRNPFIDRPEWAEEAISLLHV